SSAASDSSPESRSSNSSGHIGAAAPSCSVAIGSTGSGSGSTSGSGSGSGSSSGRSAGRGRGVSRRGGGDGGDGGDGGGRGGGMSSAAVRNLSSCLSSARLGGG